MLGIFQGKKEEYNKLILKSITTGPKTTKQVSEYIYLNRAEKPKPKDNKENEVRTIVSIVSRKKSRLEELESKNYIIHENNLWHLTNKGTCVALTLYDRVAEVYPHIQSELPSNSEMRAIMNRLHGVSRFLDVMISKGKISRAVKFGTSISFFQAVKDSTNLLIQQGVDLDRASEQGFSAMLMGELIPYYMKLEELDKFQEGVKP